MNEAEAPKRVAASDTWNLATPLDYALVVLAAIAFATSSPLAKAAKRSGAARDWQRSLFRGEHRGSPFFSRVKRFGRSP